MTSGSFIRVVRALLILLLPFASLSTALAQGAKKRLPETPIRDTDADHEEKRSQWFLHGRFVPGKSSAELRHRAYLAKMQARAARLAHSMAADPNSQSASASGQWVPLGPVPLASDASGTGFQDYHQVSGRATAVAIDPADATGNTVYIGGAQGGVWKSTNAAASIANNVNWTPLTDDQATLSIGSIAIQPGNLNASQSVILVGTGEADNAADSYFGLGFLRSSNSGSSWTLISSANVGTISLSGLGATRMAFSTATGQTTTVVAAMAATAEGITSGALTTNTYRGLYTSVDAGQSWTYDALFSGGASEATSATSVVYNATAGLFFAALRYHGFYSSPDGLTWTALANQPGASGLLNATACPQNYLTTCPLYRAEIAVVPARNEMYVWFISLDLNNNPVDQGIWQSLNGGTSWTQISDSGIVNCGDFDGCGVEQGFYNLELLALPNGAAATDLYAGAINLYKCSINSSNPECSNPPFLNLTHVYGCDPLGALAHVHPDQHAVVNTLLASGSDLMYFANDGGIYRTLNGFTGLTTGSCSGSNQFDDLNQNLGSMTQFVSFSQHATDPNTIMGGTQDNGSPATASATTSLSWGNVLSGDGGYNAIDSNTGNWFASNPDVPTAGLNIQECASGVSCNDSLFNVVVNSGDLGGDDGSFYFPYILDPQSTTSMLVGTCRVWSGPRTGGAFTLLSPNFDTLGVGTCAGTEVNLVRSMAAGGPSNSNGSEVVYATTDGPGPNTPGSPIGGNVWATTNALAVNGTVSTFSNVTLNAPGASSINPNQFPVSDVAIDTSDLTGNTAYVTVMGFTGGPGHVWQTTNAGTSWADFSGVNTGAIPDSPANAVVLDPNSHIVYVGTDVGVFQSSTANASWAEVGPIGPQTGFLPNVAVTALALFSSGGQKLLRASTYGRGVWQYNLLPDFQIAVPTSTLTVFAGATATFNGTLISINGYSNNVELSCAAGSSPLPSPCLPNFTTLAPTPAGAPFSISAGTITAGDYNFNAQGAGTDANNTTHTAALTLHVVSFGITVPSPSSVSAPTGTTSPPVSFQVTAQGSFSQPVTLSCTFSPAIIGAACNFTPQGKVNPTSSSPISMSATVSVPFSTPAATYTVTVVASTTGGPAQTASFMLSVNTNPDFVLSDPSAFPIVNAGSTNTGGSVNVTSVNGFAAAVNFSCSLTSGNGTCTANPASVSTFPGTVNVTVNAASLGAGSYQLSLVGTSGSITNTLPIPFKVGDFQLAGATSLAVMPGAQAAENLTLTPSAFYNGQVNAACNVSTIPGAVCTVSPENPIPVHAGTVTPFTANINVPGSAAPGQSNVVITAQDAWNFPSHSLTVALTIGQDFTLNSSTASESVTVGQTTNPYNLTITPVGASFVNGVTLSCGGLPAGAQCTFAPNPVTPGATPALVAMTLSTSTSTPPGTYSVTVTGVSGSLTHSTTVSLVVVAAGFALTISQNFPNADAGSQQSATVSLTPSYSGSITAGCTANALGGQCLVTPSTATITSGVAMNLTLTLNVPNSAAPNPSNSYNVALTVADSSGQPSQTVILPITVIQDFAVGSLSPATQTINEGQSASYNFAVLPVGASFAGAVSFSCSGGPTLSLCSFTPAQVTPGNTSAAVVMSITTTASSSRLFGTHYPYALWLAPAGFFLRRRGKSRKYTQLKSSAFVLALFLLVVLLTSCGGGGSNGGGTGGGQQQGTQPGTYTITVTGTSGTLSHQAANVILIVNQ